MYRKKTQPMETEKMIRYLCFILGDFINNCKSPGEGISGLKGRIKKESTTSSSNRGAEWSLKINGSRQIFGGLEISASQSRARKK